jgi:hypothetical protein
MSDDPHIRVLDVDWLDSRGPCWARSEIMSLYQGEDYFLQIDSHHRFVQDWDSKLIDYIALAPSEKPILTTYCPPYSPGELFSRWSEPTQMTFDHFTTDGIPMFRATIIEDGKQVGRLLRGRFVSAHFLFTVGSFVREVPYDPDLYFHGEEIALAVRAYTWGYDFFHHIESAGVEVAWHQRDRVSKQRVRRLLLDPIVGEFACGSVRTVAQYEAYAGINFRDSKVQGHTLCGAEPPNPIMSNDWHESIRKDPMSVPKEQVAKEPASLSRGPVADHLLDFVDGIFCLVDDASDCDGHLHPPHIVGRMERINPDPKLEPKQRRLAAWRDALSKAARRGYKHVLLWEDPSGPFDTSAPLDLSGWWKDWDLCLWSANRNRQVTPESAAPSALHGLAVVMSHGAYDRILSEIPLGGIDMTRFLARWKNFDSYILQGVPHDLITEAGVIFVSRPGTAEWLNADREGVDRPQLAGGIEVIERDEGLIVRRAGISRIHHLNNTASIVLALCDGHRTVSEIAKAFAESFALASIPVAEVSACVDALRRAGVLTAESRGSLENDYIAAVHHNSHPASRARI